MRRMRTNANDRRGAWLATGAILAAWLGAAPLAAAQEEEDIWYGHSALDTSFVLGLALSFGGHEFDHPNEPSNADISMGDGVSLFAGILQPISSLNTELIFGVGTQGGIFDEFSDRGDAKISKRAEFVEASLLYRLSEQQRFGFGAVRHFSLGIKVERAGEMGVAEFHDTSGWFVEYRFLLRPDALSFLRLKMDFSLRYTSIDYQIESVDDSTTLPDTLDRLEYSGDRVSLGAQLLF